MAVMTAQEKKTCFSENILKVTDNIRQIKQTLGINDLIL